MFQASMIFQIKNMWERFTRSHPKFPRFLQVVGSSYLQEGTVIELSVTRADGEQVASNIRLTAEDMELLAALRDLSGQAQK